MKKKIKDLLRSNKKYRKSDRVLMARIWYEDLGYKIHEMSAIELLMELSKGNLSNWETITRLRRKIQSENLELRDEAIYNARMDFEFEYRTNYGRKDTL